MWIGTNSPKKRHFGFPTRQRVSTTVTFSLCGGAGLFPVAPADSIGRGISLSVILSVHHSVFLGHGIGLFVLWSVHLSLFIGRIFGMSKTGYTRKE